MQWRLVGIVEMLNHCLHGIFHIANNISFFLEKSFLIVKNIQSFRARDLDDFRKYAENILSINIHQIELWTNNNNNCHALFWHGRRWNAEGMRCTFYGNRIHSIETVKSSEMPLVKRANPLKYNVDELIEHLMNGRIKLNRGKTARSKRMAH